jgi:hypothetical protein
MNDHQFYFAETAEAKVIRAEALVKEGRRAKAQEVLTEARYWAMKCSAESILGLGDRITILEKQLY